MKEALKHFLLFVDSSDENTKNVRVQILEENRKFAIIWSIAQMLYWIYGMVMSVNDPAFRLCRNYYIVSFVVVSITLVLAIFVAPRVKWMIYPIAFAVNAALLGTGIAIAVKLAPQTILIFASVLIVPVFFICDSMSILILLIFNVFVFILKGANHMQPEIFHWVLVNLIIFSSIGLVLGYFINKTRFERYYFAESAVQLAETNAKLAELQTRYAYYDYLTGLLNRRACGEKLEEIKKENLPDYCIVQLDINGLKETNDTKGHEAGDELIIGTVECLRKSFENTDLIYRIGGDEFCVIAKSTADRTEECLKKMEITGSKWKGKYVDGISVSYGIASGEEFDDIDSVLRAADQRMYAFKSNYYRTSEKDRRRK